MNEEVANPMMQTVKSQDQAATAQEGKLDKLLEVAHTGSAEMVTLGDVHSKQLEVPHVCAELRQRIVGLHESHLVCHVSLVWRHHTCGISLEASPAEDP